ncbi:MAG: DUF2088 domain-containing protein [Peptostreptococcaceae bacterium]|nr:DUF2088 domain-containing protein [Peptostreptococcaceae bacterium]
MKVELKYAKGKIDFEINSQNYMRTLLLNETEHLLTGKEEVKRALENPIESKRLGEIVSKGERVAIITSDITRPMPSSIVLPIVVK